MKSATLIEYYNKGAQLIYKVIDEDLSPESALITWPKDIIDTKLESAAHALLHFKEDEDIRKRDEKYASWQIDQLREIADKLSAGTDLTKSQIDWLKPR